MNVFVAGIHGVGKTYLASESAGSVGFKHASSGSLIREERSSESWTHDKLVSDIDTNQLALIAAVKRHNKANIRLLLDGHFVLLDANGKYSPLASHVFSSLNLRHVVLIEAEPETVIARIKSRDNREAELADTKDFIKVEREHARLICSELGIPITILNSPSLSEFSAVIAAIKE